MGWSMMSQSKLEQSPLVVHGSDYQDQSLVMAPEHSKGQSDMIAPDGLLDDLQM